MADGVLDGALSGEEEQPETEAPQALAGAEAFAAAISAIASRQDPGVARETEVFLREQTRLLETQRRHLEEEHASRLTQLRQSVAAASRKRYADYLRNGLYTGIALLVLGVLLAVARMTYEAVSDHGLVVQDFTVPQDFAARGVTSQALAEDLASRVAAIRATALRNSVTYSSEVRADQADILKVQIPEAGISIDELERFLHRWLGHQTLVSGELREESGGAVSLTLHIGGIDPIVVSGSGADLDRLVQSAAEKAFAVFDPDNNVIYLSATQRHTEALAAAMHNAHSASLAALSSPGRSGAYSLLASRDPDARRALAAALVETDLNPRELIGWLQAATSTSYLGHDQAMVDLVRKGLATRKQDQPLSERGAYTWLIGGGRLLIDMAVGDIGALGNDFELYDQRPEVLPTDRYAERARVAAMLHDEVEAQRQFDLALAAGPQNVAKLGPLDSTVLMARWDVASSAGDWKQALEAARALVAAEEVLKAAAPNAEFAARPEDELATQYRPLLAYAEAMTGDTAAATALISQTPTDCYLCVRTRAKVAALAGDAAGADHWFAEAMRQAPDLPLAYFEWGKALLARGDLTGATRELSLAHDKGPHFADALKVWGDVLVRQRQPRRALDEYDQALRYAPQWMALKQARNAVAGT